MTAEPTRTGGGTATGCAPSPCAACRRGSRCARPAAGWRNEPPLLLCNGIGVSLEALQPLVDALDPDRGVVRFDVPGVGGSQLPPFPYPIAALSSWVTALMSRLGHAGSTCSGCPGAAGSPSSSPSSPAAAYDGWCWSPPAPGP